jgi:hypothetical protein
VDTDVVATLMSSGASVYEGEDVKVGLRLLSLWKLKMRKSEYYQAPRCQARLLAYLAICSQPYGPVVAIKNR